MIKLPSGGPFGLPAAMLNINAVYDLAVAMLVDPTNSFAYEPHRTWPNPVDLLTNQINIEQVRSVSLTIVLTAPRSWYQSALTVYRLWTYRPRQQ